MPFILVITTSDRILCTWICGRAAMSMQKYSEEQVKRVILTMFTHYTGQELDGNCRIIRYDWHCFEGLPWFCVQLEDWF